MQNIKSIMLLISMEIIKAEITTLLVKYKYKRAALTFPRYINQN